MPLPPIELISFNLCPFVQRSVITLLEKNIDFKITYIDLANKPDWFLDISPLGKVPVVRYGDEILFESAIINEFLDEVTPPALMPSDPLQKAKDRAWIEYSSQIIVDQFLMTTASNQQDYEKHSNSLEEKLLRLEAVVNSNGFFNGSSFSLVDTALAPVFTRFSIIARQFDQDFVSKHKKLAALSERLIHLDSVQKSVIADFESVYVDYLQEKNSYVAV